MHGMFHFAILETSSKTQLCHTNTTIQIPLLLQCSRDNNLRFFYDGQNNLVEKSKSMQNT